MKYIPTSVSLDITVVGVLCIIFLKSNNQLVNIKFITNETKVSTYVLEMFLTTATVVIFYCPLKK